MTTCLSCGNEVTGKKFCSDCGTPVQPTSPPDASGQFLPTCSHCGGDVKPGASFCMHCGAALAASNNPTHFTPDPAPAMNTCPACHAQVTGTSMFCTQCGHDMHAAVAPQSVAASAFCTNCGKQNDPSVRFCGGCGNQLVAAAQTGYTQSGQYSQYATSGTTQSPYQESSYPSQPSYPQQPGYQQPSYPQQSGYQQPSYPQQPGYPQSPQSYAGQGGYQPQPMVGQPPMALRCPTCMAMAPMGTPNCVSCQTSLAGVVPTPTNMPTQGQQGLGGLMQGNAGKYAMGALGGAAAVLGGEMLLHGVENSIENQVEGDMGMGYGYGHHHHRHHHRDEGLLGGLGELANDIGL
jgi:Double zinc ribbon/zinc-ribbon domain